jgi:tRNA pseudouridine55 synthase
MQVFGLIVVDKPVGPTSHRVVNLVRAGSGVRKVGHAGTLDPRASGVLVLCLGAATRLSEYLSTASKSYEARVQFGSATRTYDAEGEVMHHTGDVPNLEAIERALPAFRGEIQQVPPPYSAVKLEGRKAYELARQGQEPDLEPRSVTIYRIEIERYEPPELLLNVECSAGTYIRSLAHDLGQALGTGAHLAALRRVKAGPFGLKQAVPLIDLEHAFAVGGWERFLIPAAVALPELPAVRLNLEQMEEIRNGRRIQCATQAAGLVKALSPEGELAAILEPVDGGDLWHPRKVFFS